jgi:hypothetical protein
MKHWCIGEISTDKKERHALIVSPQFSFFDACYRDHCIYARMQLFGSWRRPVQISIILRCNTQGFLSFAVWYELLMYFLSNYYYTTSYNSFGIHFGSNMGLNATRPRAASEKYWSADLWYVTQSHISWKYKYIRSFIIMLLGFTCQFLVLCVHQYHFEVCIHEASHAFVILHLLPEVAFSRKMN